MLGLTVFGDSVMKGVECIGNKYRLSAERFAPKNFSFKSFCKLGCTSDKGLAILEREVGTLEKGGSVLLEYGGNDSDFDWQDIANTPQEEHSPKVSVKKFIETLNKMIDIVDDCGCNPVLMTLPPLDPYRYFDHICESCDGDNVLLWLGRKEVIYTFQEQYSLAIARTALERGTGLVDVRSAFLEKKNFFPYLSEDGIHPSSSGHRLISDTLLNYFNNLQSESLVNG